MDTLAHVTIGVLCCSRSGFPGGHHGAVNPDNTRKRFDWTAWAAAGFALIPDMSSFGAFMIQRLATGAFTPGKPPVETLPQYVFNNYNLTHSLVIALAVGIVIRLAWKPLFLPFLAWPLHILCDIPLHSREYFPTPFLYPLSDFTFDAWSFGEHRWLIPLYWLIIGIAFLHLRKLRGQESPPSPKPGECLDC